MAVTGTGLRLRAEQPPAPELLALIRAHKIELVEILAGHRCRACGEAIAWRVPGAVAFADGAAAHLTCYERRSLEGQWLEERPRTARDAGPDPERSMIASSIPTRAEQAGGPHRTPKRANGAADKSTDREILREARER